MADKTNLVVDQGTDYFTVIVFKDENDETFDLSDYVVTGQIRKSYASTNSYSFVVEELPLSGVILLKLPASNSSAMEIGRYVYDVELSHALSNTVFRICEGIVSITPNVTR